MDIGNYLCAAAAVSFYKEIGGSEAILRHLTPLLDWAAQMLADAMGTEKLQVPKSMEAPYMRTIGEDE